MRLGSPHKFCVHAYMAPVLSGRIKLPISAQDEMCDLSSFSLQSGKGAVSKGGSLWFPFFRHFFVERQRNGIQAGTAHAHEVQGARRQAQSVKNLYFPHAKRARKLALFAISFSSSPPKSQICPPCAPAQNTPRGQKPSNRPVPCKACHSHRAAPRPHEHSQYPQ